MKKLRVLLHPTDFSASAEHALRLACDFASTFRARLILLHVAAPLPSQWVGSGLSLLHSHKGWWELEAKLRSINCGDLRPERILRTGSPAEVIIEVASQVNADLIVVGQPQPGRWRWLVEERIANNVVRTASCPVLIASGYPARAKHASQRREKSSSGPKSGTSRRLELATSGCDWSY